MRCWYCELEGGPGGTLYGIGEAVGVCVVCGTGVCLKHAQRTAEETSIVCPEHGAAAELTAPAFVST